MALSKSYGLDGMSALFLQKFWACVCPAVVKMVTSLFKHGVLPSDVNKTLITLIPKVSQSESLKDLRPIRHSLADPDEPRDPDSSLEVDRIQKVEAFKEQEDVNRTYSSVLEPTIVVKGFEAVVRYLQKAFIDHGVLPLYETTILEIDDKNGSVKFTNMSEVTGAKGAIRFHKCLLSLPINKASGTWLVQILEIEDKNGSAKFTNMGQDIVSNQVLQYTVRPDVWSEVTGAKGAIRFHKCLLSLPINKASGTWLVQILEIEDKNGSAKFTNMGQDIVSNQVLQYTVRPDVWFGAVPSRDFDIVMDNKLVRKAPRNAEKHSMTLERQLSYK
ncbi:rmlC-like jelly roll fold protein [Artemisia annua]|uniref:RmlC-like jelly roll fold protein n=1 Tax=Artemisia annua TaxID=35608 RepID=A0A2U1LR34_ARTAN|nr:rmlC-like jelly roll fold protein [Artemisia annua]